MWWTWRPLAAARAVIFAQLVNALGYQQLNKQETALERQQLFKILEELA